MGSALLAVLAPLISIAFIMLSNGYFLTFISLRLKIEGLSDAMVGLVQSSYYFGMLLGTIKMESFIRRTGHIRAFAAFASIMTVTILVQGFIVEPLTWITLRFIAGICIAALYIVIESWCLLKSTPETRGAILAFYMVALYGSQAFSQFILDIANSNSLEPYLAAGFLCSLSVVPVAWTYRPSPELHEPGSLSLLDLFKACPFGFLGCLIAGIILSSIYSFTPIYAQDFSFSVSKVMFATIAGGFLLQWPIGYLSDLFDRRRVLVATSLGVIVPSLILFFAVKNLDLTLVLSFILGGLCFTIYPLSITHACDRIHPKEITSATSMLLLSYGIGAVIGPLLAPFFMGSLTAAGLYLYIGLCGVILSGIGIFALLRRPAVPMEDQQEFVSLPPVAQVAYELDPRQESPQ